MANIVPPSQDDKAAEEPLIPMPSVTPPADDAAATPADEPTVPEKKPTPTIEKKSDTAAPTSTPEPSSTPATPSSSGDSSLDDIKQKTLTELKPLLDEVDLPAEDKFHTILEIISATNDKELIPKLYDAAAGIEDKHERAQALVDVLSEIEFLSGGTKN